MFIYYKSFADNEHDKLWHWLDSLKHKHNETSEWFFDSHELTHAKYMVPLMDIQDQETPILLVNHRKLVDCIHIIRNCWHNCSDMDTAYLLACARLLFDGYIMKCAKKQSQLNFDFAAYVLFIWYLK